MEPQFSQTLPPHSIGFILQDRDAKLGNHGPKIHLVERFCVMKSEPCRILKGRTGCIESFSVHADTREPAIARGALAAGFDECSLMALFSKPHASRNSRTTSLFFRLLNPGISSSKINGDGHELDMRAKRTNGAIGYQEPRQSVPLR